MQHAGIELGPHRYDATLLTSTHATLAGHKPRIVHTTIITRVRAGEVGGAHYPKWRRSCRDLRFSLEMWDWRRTIAWGRCTHLTIVDQFGITISGFTPSYEALGLLLKKKKNDDENSKIAYERFLV